MQVQLKLDDLAITLGNKGVLLKIAGNDGKHVGDLRIGRATVEWMPGRTREGNGTKIKLEDPRPAPGGGRLRLQCPHERRVVLYGRA